MKQYFLNLIAFDHWANSKLLVALAGASSLPARAPAVFSHLLASTQVWHARLVGQEVRVPVWPEWAPAVESIKKCGAVEINRLSIGVPREECSHSSYASTGW